MQPTLSAPGEGEMTLAEYRLQPSEPVTLPSLKTAVIARSAGAGLLSSNCTRVQVFPARASMDVVPSPPFPVAWPVAGGAAQPSRAARARVASWRARCWFISHLLGWHGRPAREDRNEPTP